MPQGYEVNDLAKEDSWRMFRIIGELVEGFDELAGVEPAITIYGSARLKEDSKLYIETEEIARRLGELGFNIITGGGPGVMAAANKGALEAGVASIGLNIELPEEQALNPYTTQSITFHHFFVRKVMLVKYATAFLMMPGGLGTLDELTEVLTMMQTHKIKPFPVVLYDSKYWDGFMDWLHKQTLSRDFVSEEDFDLLRMCDTPDEVIQTIQQWYIKREIVGRRAVAR
ncbi:MAG TPA: TIGR00730 family Rossman fold protein [Dehalococcoidia bacterium]